MRKYFVRKKYQIQLISEEYFNKWLTSNPQFAGKVDYQKFKRYWRYIRTGIIEKVLSNSSGVDFPLELGNWSAKILDIDFQGKEDMLVTKASRPGGEKVLEIVPSLAPKKAKIVWKKHRLYRHIPASLGFEAAKTFKRAFGKGVKNREHFYEKLAGYDKKKSKHIKIDKPFSIFDIA